MLGGIPSQDPDFSKAISAWRRPSLSRRAWLCVSELTPLTCSTKSIWDSPMLAWIARAVAPLPLSPEAPCRERCSFHSGSSSNIHHGESFVYQGLRACPSRSCSTTVHGCRADGVSPVSTALITAGGGPDTFHRVCNEAPFLLPILQSPSRKCANGKIDRQGCCAGQLTSRARSRKEQRLRRAKPAAASDDLR